MIYAVTYQDREGTERTVGVAVRDHQIPTIDVVPDALEGAGCRHVRTEPVVIPLTSKPPEAVVALQDFVTALG